MNNLWTSELSADSESFIEGMFEPAPDPACDGILLWDRRGRLEAFSEPVFGLLGLPHGSLSLGMDANDLHGLQKTHRDARFLNGFHADPAGKGMTVLAPHGELRVILDSGRAVRVDTRSRRDGGHATVVSELAGFAPDETAPSDGPDALRGIFEACPIGVLVLCNDTNECLLANQPLTSWFGADFVRTIAGAAPRPVGDQTDDLVSVLLDPDFSIEMIEYEIEHQSPTGETRWMLLSGRPITFEGCAARVIWFRDISVRRRQAQDLQSKVAEKTRQLEQALHRADLASLAKTQFLANMSHELRTPLNSIIGFSDLLQKEMFGPIGSERYVEFVQHIHSAGAHLLELINDILDVSRIELGEMGLREDVFDIGRSVSATIAMIRPKLAEKGQHFSADLPDGPVGFRGDERQIRQILMNLLTNAVKFTGTDGAIALKLTTSEEDGVVLEIKDNGIGIREADLERVLNPFEQATDETYSRSIEGAGLGLYLTQAIAKAHGGELSIDSEVNRGTTVTVTLPAERIQQRA